ncbi:MAG: oxidative damage protection protein [SAR86 cluster bacterium]|jgi:Fe-S cluster biosynthesis and repair protein YggX|nr:oxidative damage protection protein [SAR86 cluster bacterium]
MTRIIFCKKYKKDLEGLDKPPHPGPKGEEIFDTLSKKAWDEWLENQKMLINENQLNLQDKESRNWLKEQMELFFSGEDYARPKGFIPPKS